MTRFAGVAGIIGVGIWLSVNGWKFYRAGGVKKILPTIKSSLATAQVLLGKGRKLAGATIAGGK